MRRQPDRRGRAPTGSRRSARRTGRLARSRSLLCTELDGIWWTPALLDERRRPRSRNHVDARPATGDRDVEDAPLLLDIGCQPMRELVGGGVVDDDHRPLLALDAVDGGQRDPIGLPATAQLGA